MTEFHPRVFLIDKVLPHPNPESTMLELINVDGGYPCCVQIDKYKAGMTAIYIPVDTMVNTSIPEFSFLNKTGTEDWVRIKAMSLKNVFSMGLIIPNVGDWPIGYEPINELQLKRFEPVCDNDNDDTISDLSLMPTYDLEPLRMHHSKFRIGEAVIVTEKINGTNSGFVFSSVYHSLILRSSTRHRRFNPNSHSEWNRVARDLHLEDILRSFPDIGFYGEICGGGLVKGFNYGISNPIERQLLIFDVIDTKSHTWYRHSDAARFIEELNSDNQYGIELKMVPWCCIKQWEGIDDEDLLRYAEGKSNLGNHIREGIVIESLERERFDDGTRAKLKLHGQDYLLGGKKGKKERFANHESC